MSSRPEVGIGVIITDNGKVLLGKRKNAHGAGTWSFPGGKLDYAEGIFDCAKREVLEETGLKIKNLRLGPYTNDFFQEENRHFITLYVIAEKHPGEPQVLEPDKCDSWEWFDWDELPEPRFLPLKNLLRSGFNPFST